MPSGIPPTTRLGLMTPSETDAYVAALVAELDALREALDEIAFGTFFGPDIERQLRQRARAALEHPE